MNKLSIITINLNNVNGLRKTIESVINQTYVNKEYIVIDGASEDESIDVIKEYENSISTWISEPDTGIYSAMNKGISKSTGEYLLFLNSGDYLFSDTILKMLFHEKQKSDLIYGNQLRIDRTGKKTIVFPEKLTFYHFYTEFIAHNCTFIKRDLFRLIGFYNENYKIVSDWEFFILAVCKHNCTTKYVNSTISAMIAGGISNDISFRNLGIHERQCVLQEHFHTFIDDYNELYRKKYYSFYKRLKRTVKFILRPFLK